MLQLLLVSLFPFAVYLFALAGLNRRERPALVSGTWEMLGLLFAFSGFLLYSGPLLIQEFYVREIINIPVGEGTAQVFEDAYLKWLLIWAAYYLGLIALALGLVLSRRHSCGVYNVDPPQFRLALAQTIEALGLSARVQEKTLFLFSGSRAGDPAMSELPVSLETAIQAEEENGARLGLPARERSFVEQLPVPSRDAPLIGELTVEAFPTLSHVTLFWGEADPAFRHDFEAALERNLEPAAALDSNVANWLLGFASLLFGVLFMLMAMWVFNFFFPRRFR